MINFGVAATHELISPIRSLNEAPSISDFDAFAFDPSSFQQAGVTPENFFRRQREIRDLVTEKGGLIVCLLRPPVSLGFNGLDCYSLFDVVGIAGLNRAREILRAGWGSRIEAVAGAKGASAAYYRILRGTLRFAAYLDLSLANVEIVGAKVLAVDSVPHPVGLEFAVGAARICFVPVPEQVPDERVGSALVRVLEAHYGGAGEIDAPVWAAGVTVPGATAHDATIRELEERKLAIEAEAEQLRDERASLQSYRVLLYGYGKSVLEPIVRSSFRLLGFNVPEPDEYRGEWDVEVHEPSTSETAIGEVEGSEGVIDVEKFRQLLNYVQDEALDGRDHRGLLIGNGYRLTAPEAPERQSQFSTHALNGARKNGYCLLPTTELFKAVCAVLEAPEDEGQRIAIRHSILSSVGVWGFARPSGTSAKATSAVAAEPAAPSKSTSAAV